ncbi:MAG: TniB family NTP-binding protein [Anaerolineales bacterium]
MTEDLSRNEVLSLRFEERIPYLNKIVVNYRRGNELMEMMEECYQNCLDGTTQPPGMMIVGPSGAGKSTLVDLFVARHPAAKTEMGKKVPVLKFTVDAPANKGNLVSSILDAFGDPLHDRGLIGSRSYRIRGYIDDCRTAMIIADEIQHFIDPNKTKLLLDVSNWFKI